MGSQAGSLRHGSQTSVLQTPDIRESTMMALRSSSARPVYYFAYLFAYLQIGRAKLLLSRSMQPTWLGGSLVGLALPVGTENRKLL